MAKTFQSKSGDIVEIVDFETEVDCNEDIVTGDISSYFVIVSDYKYEVDERTYSAVKKHIE